MHLLEACQSEFNFFLGNLQRRNSRRNGPSFCFVPYLPFCASLLYMKNNLRGEQLNNASENFSRHFRQQGKFSDAQQASRQALTHKMLLISGHAVHISLFISGDIFDKCFFFTLIIKKKSSNKWNKMHLKGSNWLQYGDLQWLMLQDWLSVKGNFLLFVIWVVPKFDKKFGAALMLL